MKLLKKIMPILLIIIIAIVIVACSKQYTNEEKYEGANSNKMKNSDYNDKDKENTAQQEETTVVVWSSNRHDAKYCNKKVAEFNESNKGRIQIEYVVHGDNYVNLIMMASSTNQMPDVINIASYKTGFHIQSFVDTNMVQSLNSYITDEFAKMVELESVKYQGMNVIDDNIYYVPTGLRSGSRIIYNKELFEKAGITEMPEKTDDIVDIAKKITEIGNGIQYGYVVPGFSEPWVRMLNPIAEVSGISMYDYINGKFDFTGYKPIMEMMRQLFEDGSVLPGAASMKMDPSRVQFSEGNVGFYGSMSQEVGVLTEQFPAKFEWGAAEIPSLDGIIKGALATAPNMGWLMSAQTKHAEAAWEVIQFFSSDDFVKGYIESGLNLPITKRIDELLDKSKMGKLSEFTLLDYESVYPLPPQVSPEGKVWRDALWEACLPSGPSIDKTIAELNKAYNEAFEKAVKMGKVKRLVIKDYDPLNPNSGTFEYLSK